MDIEIRATKMDVARAMAVLGFWKWFLPILVSVAVFVAGVVVPRLWPVQPAHAAYSQTVRAVEVGK